MNVLRSQLEPPPYSPFSTPKEHVLVHRDRAPRNLIVDEKESYWWWPQLLQVLSARTVIFGSRSKIVGGESVVGLGGKSKADNLMVDCVRVVGDA
jgi:hypothetical protein